MKINANASELSNFEHRTLNIETAIDRVGAFSPTSLLLLYFMDCGTRTCIILFMEFYLCILGFLLVRGSFLFPIVYPQSRQFSDPRLMMPTGQDSW